MLSWFNQVSAFAVFLGIASVGFLFLLVSLIFGEIFQHFGDSDLGHEVDHGDHGGPGFFSVRVVSVFITAFGGFGAVATHYGLSTLPASGVGFVSGMVFASLIYGFARFLYGQQATSGVRSSEFVGQTARVVVAIPAGGVGQVRCRIGEEIVDKIARSDDGQSIPDNTVVRIEDVLGDTVVVRRQ